MKGRNMLAKCVSNIISRPVCEIHGTLGSGRPVQLWYSRWECNMSEATGPDVVSAKIPCWRRYTYRLCGTLSLQDQVPNLAGR